MGIIVPDDSRKKTITSRQFSVKGAHYAITTETQSPF